MEPFSFSPRSPMINTPVCDSDEEVFFGPVTTKELQKASQLKRRTQHYFPSLEWKPSVSTIATESLKSVADKDLFGKPTASPSLNQNDQSVSSDSLDSHCYATASEKPEDSSKGEYWSAFSGDSLDTNSKGSLNEATMFTRFSEDSLDSQVTYPSDKKTEAPSMYSKISGDSLVDSSKQPMNTSRIHLESNSEESSGGPDGLSVSKVQSTGSAGNLAGETHLVSDNSYNNDSLECLGVKNATFCTKTDNALSVTHDVLPLTGNTTYSIGSDSCQIVDLDGPPSTNMALSEEVPVDNDGGFLSILSEAALYHASKLKGNGSSQDHAMEESTRTTQSLEDRFKVFGIDAGDLENQLLSNSIMYATGRDSHLPYSETENNTFYTGRNSDVQSSRKSIDQQSSKGAENLTGTESQNSASDCGQYSNILNCCIENGTLGTAESTSQDSEDDCGSYQQRKYLGEDGTLNQSDDYREVSEISGVCALDPTVADRSNSSIQSLSEETPSHNDSGASSCAGEFNDTLEEYEMMMRYGVDYILGRKVDKKKSDDEYAEGRIELNPQPRQDEDNASLMGNTQQNLLRSFPLSPQKNSSTSSVQYLNAVEISPSRKQMGHSHLKDQETLSPLHKQVLKCTPQKPPRDLSSVSKGSVQKMPSKLPRVATVTPSKVSHLPSPLHGKPPRTPCSESKAKIPVRPETPSSETKAKLFKKPVMIRSRIPKTAASTNNCPKSNNKILEKIQSPVGAYIHNSPSPVLVTNFKAKMTDRDPFEKEMHARALWRAGEVKSGILKPGGSQGVNLENINPNIGCGLPAVKYTKAPCIKLDEATKMPNSRVGERITKLIDTPLPQVIKHEGRLRVKCGSPQLAAKMQSMADTLDDSMADMHSLSGDISVCVSQQACRTNTLGH